MSEYKIPISDVENFLIGHDDEKYIVNIEYDAPTNTIYKFKQLPDGSKVTETDTLTSFMWMKNLGDLKKLYNFYGNNDLKIKNARKEYGIEVTALNHENHPRLVDGYKFLITCNQGHSRMLDFFKNGGFYRGIYDQTNDVKSHFMLLSPIEQYLISTGKRLFKGYEDYNDIDKLVFDLETTGLDPEVSRIFMVGCKTNKGLEELFDCETEGENADKTEVAAILKLFKVIEIAKPSIIGGYNSANFDWPFIFKRCEKLGIDITEIAKTLKPGEIITNKETSIKLGNEVETYMQTNMAGYSIIDIIHSARRAQAIDSSMKSASLKYVCKYNKIAKKNRVYIKGDKIGTTWKSDAKYYFDNNTGSYLDKKPKLEKLDFITRDIVKDNPKKIFIFGDNDEKTGHGGQAKEMRGEINTIGIPTKKKPTMELDSFYSDEEFDVNKKKINFAISQMLNKVKEGYDIVIPSNGIGTGLSQLNIKAPKTYQFLIASLNAVEKYINESWVEVDGKYIVLGGNMRLKAAIEVGLKELPILLADDWTQEQRDEFLIKDNVGFGEWNWDDLANEWDAEKLTDWGLDVWQSEPDIDYSILDDDDLSGQLDDMTNGVKKAIQIEFELEHYESAFELVKFWRERKAYVGGMIMEYLKAEKEKI